MMDLTQASINILAQLKSLVIDIDQDDFCQPSPVLSNSTIGQHLRHTLEFFICLERGFETGVINYDKREHDVLIESDKFMALEIINRIIDFVSNFDSEKELLLEAGYDLSGDKFITIRTNARRELVYNIEHAVHHMAIMKIGIREIAPHINIPRDFGIAVSTVRYKDSRTQLGKH
jgi:hypothetical protein